MKIYHGEKSTPLPASTLMKPRAGQTKARANLRRGKNRSFAGATKSCPMGHPRSSLRSEFLSVSCLLLYGALLIFYSFFTPPIFFYPRSPKNNFFSIFYLFNFAKPVSDFRPNNRRLIKKGGVLLSLSATKPFSVVGHSENGLHL